MPDNKFGVKWCNFYYALNSVSLDIDKNYRTLNRQEITFIMFIVYQLFLIIISMFNADRIISNTAVSNYFSLPL